ncbi:MAG: hypothetical protein HY600_06010 [Candidatus Omnitrophica bacterium]|nr:hypothetical protein [Candidatus Omnitrophota bacterium]
MAACLLSAGVLLPRLAWAGELVAPRHGAPDPDPAVSLNQAAAWASAERGQLQQMAARAAVMTPRSAPTSSFNILPAADLDGNGKISAYEALVGYVTAGRMAAGVAPVDLRFDLTGDGRVTIRDWVAMGVGLLERGYRVVDQQTSPTTRVARVSSAAGLLLLEETTTTDLATGKTVGRTTNEFIYDPAVGLEPVAVTTTAWDGTGHFLHAKTIVREEAEGVGVATINLSVGNQGAVWWGVSERESSGDQYGIWSSTSDAKGQTHYTELILVSSQPISNGWRDIYADAKGRLRVEHAYFTDFFGVWTDRVTYYDIKGWSVATLVTQADKPGMAVKRIDAFVWYAAHAVTQRISWITLFPQFDPVAASVGKGLLSGPSPRRLDWMAAPLLDYARQWLMGGGRGARTKTVTIYNPATGQPVRRMVVQVDAVTGQEISRRDEQYVNGMWRSGPQALPQP